MATIKGLLPAALTPMSVNGDINIDAVHDQAAYFTKVGAAGVFINGTSAEWTSLTIDERMSLTSAWGTYNSATFKVIDHVGHHSQRDAIHLAKHAQECGVSGISAVAPSYFPMNSAQSIVDWCAPIAEAASNCPFYYYDLPQLTGVSVPAYDFGLLAKEQIPTFAGIKYSGIDPAGLQRCLSLGDEYDIFWGSDENLLVGLAFGCQAAVGSTYNVFLEHYSKIILAFETGDHSLAQGLQREALCMVEHLIPNGVIPSLKAIQPLTGYSLGASRLPFKPLDNSVTDSLQETIKSMGILDTV